MSCGLRAWTSTKAGKEWRENQNVPVITTADGANIDGMFGTLKAHPAADSILRSLPKREVAVFAELCGLYCKCRLDALGHDDNGNLTIADLKMRQDARPDVFARDMANEHLDFQAAFYSDLLGRALDLEAAPFWLWIAVEENAPWAVAVYSPEETVMESGRRKYERALALLTMCRQTGRWPAYPENVQNINLPRWAIE
jgi:hypothetical protein